MDSRLAIPFRDYFHRLPAMNDCTFDYLYIVLRIPCTDAGSDRPLGHMHWCPCSVVPLLEGTYLSAQSHTDLNGPE